MMVSLMKCTFYSLCCTLIIFAFVKRNNCEMNTVTGSTVTNSSTDYVEIVLEHQEPFVAFYPQLPVYYTNDLIKSGIVSPAQSLSYFSNQLEAATSLVNVAEAVGKFLSTIDTFKSVIELFFNLLPHDSDYEKILHQFNTVYEKLDALTNKMEEIEKKILIAIDWRPYKDQRHMVLAVSESFSSMAMHPNDTTFKMKFIESCKANRMEDRLEWLEREMNRAYADSMVYSLTSQFHMDFFLSRSADVLTTATKAAFLLGACLRREQEIDDISEGYIKNAENISSSKVLSITKSIRDGKSAIKSGYFKYLEGEIDSQTKAAGEMANDKFAESLYKYISTKYNWKTWFVGSYNGNTRGFAEHALFWGGTSVCKRYNNRHVLVATTLESTKPSESDLIKQKFAYCLRQHFFAVTNFDYCLLLGKELDGCLKTSTIIKGQF